MTVTITKRIVCVQQWTFDAEIPDDAQAHEFVRDNYESLLAKAEAQGTVDYFEKENPDRDGGISITNEDGEEI